MRVFVTGASGHIASAVIPELIEAGHEVSGLARSDRSAQVVEALGARTVRGDLSRLDVLRQAAGEADGVVHLALFDADEMRAGNMAGAGAAGAKAVAALGDALAGTGKPLISAAAIGALGPQGRPAVESDIAPTQGPAAAESVVLGLAERSVRAAVVRLPLITHSRPNRRGFAGALIDIARRTGMSGYAGDGTNRWPAVHTIDAGRLFRLALEDAPAGTRWHAVHDEGVPLRDVAETIGEHLGLPAVSIPDEQLPQHFGFLSTLVAFDLPAVSTATQSRLHWTPTHPRLMDDLAYDDFYTV
ncbi:SDR family oxidoreductase [Gryllotalpicola ginsengisoli]|uniref:SDR family oxidoreductase n=1 Tax=Gryllotalpicola ginsengisoli TaxID=444608 RepID=UPI0003B50E14|nr:SDR family oxidoreductase [Gryllotalpicola ginsengisoli]